MLIANIVAGGNGTRMGNTNLPKQYLTIGSKPIIIHTIEQFILINKFDKIIISVADEYVSYMNDLLTKYFKGNDSLIVICGGSDRNETIMKCCDFIKTNYDINDCYLVIHDAVRPFVTNRIIEENIEMVKKYGAVDTVVSATDTIVESQDGENITNIPLRTDFYHGQTPQSFKVDKLLEVYSSLNKKEIETLTDTCKVFTLKGEKVALVKGEVYNFKITNLYDLKIANAIIEGKIQV